MFRLKRNKERFTVVEGPFAGKSFAHGQLYGNIPPDHAAKFEEIHKAAPVKAAPVKTAAGPAKAEAEKGQPQPGRKGGGKL